MDDNGHARTYTLRCTRAAASQACCCEHHRRDDSKLGERLPLSGGQAVTELSREQLYPVIHSQTASRLRLPPLPWAALGGKQPSVWPPPSGSTALSEKSDRPASTRHRRKPAPDFTDLSLKTGIAPPKASPVATGFLCATGGKKNPTFSTRSGTPNWHRRGSKTSGGRVK